MAERHQPLVIKFYPFLLIGLQQESPIKVASLRVIQHVPLIQSSLTYTMHRLTHVNKTYVCETLVQMEHKRQGASNQ